MKKKMVALLLGTMLAGTLSMAVAAEGKEISTADGLIDITLPADDWYVIATEEDAEMFSDGDCAIKVNFFKNGDTLPVIESADANHEMIYTAAASTQDYVMHVVGYAHKQEDFSAICKAINSIHVNSLKLTDDKLKKEVSVASYGIVDANYTAYVCASELNVRSTSEDGAIITTLANGEEVTVTGLVVRDGAEIGWARIKTADGTEGYTSTQFLTTARSNASGETKDETSATQDRASRTGFSFTVYSGDDYYFLYQYTDGTVRDDWGNVYVKDSQSTWMNTSDGSYCTIYEATENGWADQFVVTNTVYSIDGRQKDISMIGDNLYEDRDGVQYHGYGQGTYIDDNGEMYYVGGMTSVDYPVDDDTFIGYGNIEYGTVLVNDGDGNEFYITKGDRSFWYDEGGNTYDQYDSYGSFKDADGNIIHISAVDSEY